MRKMMIPLGTICRCRVKRELNVEAQPLLTSIYVYLLFQTCFTFAVELGLFTNSEPIELNGV